MKVEESGQSESGQSHESPLSEREPISADFACDICDKSFGTENSLKAHMLRAHRQAANWTGGNKAAKASDANDEQEIADDFRRESRTASSALALARTQSRLKSTDPHLFRVLYGHEEDGSPTKALVDLEVAKTLKAMREEEPVHQNNGDSNETAVLKREVTDLKEALRQKDLQSLRDENAKINEELKEIRSELRSSAGSNSSDLAVVVRETSNLIGKALESPGVLRNYLLPDGISIGKKADAPALHVEPSGTTVISELSKHGLVTQVLRKGD